MGRKRGSGERAGALVGQPSSEFLDIDSFQPAYLTTRRPKHAKKVRDSCFVSRDSRKPWAGAGELERPCFVTRGVKEASWQLRLLVPLSSARLAPRPDGPLTHFTSPRGEKRRPGCWCFQPDMSLNQPCLDAPRPEHLNDPPVAGAILQPEADCRLMRGEGVCADLVLAGGCIADFLQEARGVLVVTLAEMPCNHQAALSVDRDEATGAASCGRTSRSRRAQGARQAGGVCGSVTGPRSPFPGETGATARCSP